MKSDGARLVLVTGGTRGLGLVAAQRLAAQGASVVIGCRTEEDGKRVAGELGVDYVVIDVRSDGSVEDAARDLDDRFGRLDVLVNNAGVAGPRTPIDEVTADQVRHVYETNVFGVVRTTLAMLPLLRASSHGVIVNVASGLGSFGIVTNPDRMESGFAALVYGSSKAALLAMTHHYAKALPELRVNAVDPGYTATEFNSYNGTQTVEEGTDARFEMALVGPDGPTGTFRSREGAEPW